MKETIATAGLFLLTIVPLALWLDTPVMQVDPGGQCVAVLSPGNHHCGHLPERYSIEVVGYDKT